MSKTTVVALGFILIRLVYLGLPDLFPEEAYYWNYAMHPDFGYLDHPPMVAWLIHLGTRIFGNTEFGIRIFALVCSQVSAFFIYRLTCLLFDRTAARTSFLIMQVLPVFFLTGFMMTPDVPLIACWSGALYCLGRVLFAGSTRAWFGFGICLGLGMLSKYTIALLVPSLFVFMVLDPQSRVWFRRFTPYLAGVIAAVVFSPVIIWNALHGWMSFAFQTTGRLAAQRYFSLHLLLVSILILLSPVVAILAVRLLAAWKRPATDEERASVEWRRGLFARVFVLVPLSVFVIFSLTHRVKLNWSGPAWLVLVPALAAFLVALPEASGWRRAWTVTIGVLAAIYIGFFQYLTTGFPGVGYVDQMELVPVGWSEFGRELERRKEELKESTGGEVRIVGMDRYFIATEASFYQKDQVAGMREITGAHLFGGNSLMYRLWSPAAGHDGATLLLVAFNKNDLDSRKIPKLSTPVGPVEEVWIERDGKKICRYYVRVVSNYRSR